LITVAGTKYTTARAVAERVTDLVFRKLGREVAPCRTATMPLPFKASVDLVEAVRDEMVVTLADAVIRRTPMGALGCPDVELTRAAAVGASSGIPGGSRDRRRHRLFYSAGPPAQQARRPALHVRPPVLRDREGVERR
jgi:glycerol-3-phosphate dehydrogenase